MEHRIVEQSEPDDTLEHRLFLASTPGTHKRGVLHQCRRPGGGWYTLSGVTAGGAPIIGEDLPEELGLVNTQNGRLFKRAL